MLSTRDWSATPLGDISEWPQSLRTALDICLNVPVASALAWGPARTHIYNERYRLLCDLKDANSMGTDFAECWPDSWPNLRAPFEQAFAGQTSHIESRGESLLSFSFIPVRNELGAVGGVYIAVEDAEPRAELERTGNDLKALHYALSHDLRSPLRMLTEICRIRMEDSVPPLPEDIQGFLLQFIRGAEKLDERAKSLLSFIQISRQPLKHRHVRMQALVEEALAVLRHENTGRSIEIGVNPLPDTIGDAEMIRQLVFIALSNAFKFTRHTESARIDIDARPAADQTVFCVSDNGAGFDMKYASKMFGLFQRMHRESEFEGEGAGLALARRIVERHGGKIWAEGSKHHGAKLYFTLPAMT